MRCASIEHSRSRRGRRPRRRDTEPELEGPFGAAERVAAEKARWVRQLVDYVLIVGLLYLFIRPVGVIVGLVWGLGLAGDFVKKVLEPGLRRRWVTKEVQRQLDGRVSEERREIQGRHQRSLEALSASIAHEIRNPITAAKSLVQQMGEDPHANENVRYANVALDELDRVEKSISHLLRYAREEEMAMTSLRMADVVDSALAVHQDRTARLGVEVRREIDSVGAMRGDPEKLRRVLVNLLGNALDALEEARTERPRLDVALGENLAGTEVWVRVRDNGPGIDARVLEKIFDPFYTSKPTGTGLGLALSKKVVDAHGGALEAHSTPGAGTEFVLSFPKRTEARS